MSKYKLDRDQMAEAEMVLEEMGTDPDAIAFELVWRRHNKAPDQNTQVLGEIAMAIADDVPKEICLTVDGFATDIATGEKNSANLRKSALKKCSAKPAEPMKQMQSQKIDCWPCNSTRFLLPTIAVRGFWRQPMKLTLAFWIWRIDFDILPNGKEDPQ